MRARSLSLGAQGCPCARWPGSPRRRRSSVLICHTTAHWRRRQRPRPPGPKKRARRRTRQRFSTPCSATALPSCRVVCVCASRRLLLSRAQLVAWPSFLVQNCPFASPPRAEKDIITVQNTSAVGGNLKKRSISVCLLSFRKKFALKGKSKKLPAIWLVAWGLAEGAWARARGHGGALGLRHARQSACRRSVAPSCTGEGGCLPSSVYVGAGDACAPGVRSADASAALWACVRAGVRTERQWLGRSRRTKQQGQKAAIAASRLCRKSTEN